MCVSATKPYKNKISSHKYNKRCLIYILIAILFFAHKKVNVAAIFDFFI